ncbi:MAG: hypothetical protein ABR969_05010 [Sedimentisphaerales bacterium]|jgi:hypothetical protein
MCKLNEKFKEWKKWYSEDRNSVCAQISLMLLDAAVFYAINEARKYATVDAQGNQELNYLVHGLINRTFIGTQSLSIRKLCVSKNTCSLGRLINDMKKNKALLTRKNVLSALGFPYDYEDVIKEGCQTNNPTMRFNGAQSERVHKNIDLLTGVKPERRQQNDTIQDSVFDQLKKSLDKCKPIVTFADKIVAHTTPSNKDIKISLAKIHNAHCRIVRAAAFIGQVILYEPSGWNFLPAYAGGDKFEHLEKPWIRQGDISKLKDFWSRYEKHIKRLSERPERRII